MSIREMKKNKKYQIEVAVGYNGSKKIRHYKTFYGSKKDAYIEEAKIKNLVRTGSYIPKTNITMKDLSEEYLELQKPLLAPKTYATYKYRIDVINQYLGYVKVRELNVKILENFYNYLRKDYISSRGAKLSPTTIQSYYAVINNMLSTAKKWDYIKENMNERIDKPKRARTQIQCYSPAEVDLLLKCLKQEPLKYQALILLALDLGCRRGELTGLTWNDIDFETGKVYITKSTQYVNGKIIEKETKTVNSNRVNYISQSTLELLRRYRVEQQKKQLKLGSKWEKSNRVFTTETGGNIHPDTPTKIFYRIIRKYNLKKITFHGLRHTNVSLMISKGIQAQIISKKVGHSSIQITHTFYSHFYEDEFKDVAKEMDAVWSKVL